MKSAVTPKSRLQLHWNCHSNFKVICPALPCTACSAEANIFHHFHVVYAWLVTAKRAVSYWVLEGLACASKHRHILIRVQQTPRLTEQYCVEVTQRNSGSQRQLFPPSAGIAMYLCSSVHLPPACLPPACFFSTGQLCNVMIFNQSAGGKYLRHRLARRKSFSALQKISGETFGIRWWAIMF